MQKVLIIDDDPDICFLLNKFLAKSGFMVFEARTAQRALELLEKDRVDVVLCDYRLEPMNGSEMICKIKERQNVPVIIITAHNDLKVAVGAMKLGAFDFVLKPLFPDEILATINAALNNTAALNGNLLEEQINDMSIPVRKRVKDDEYIFGESPALRKILEQISRVAPTDYSVIIYGESGSGKEAIAQEIHKRSKRASFPFIPIDCGALSKELAASELFGHEKGSFTGALNLKIGSFELANGGTIFLDEIANLSYDVQVSLLRVVQERKMKRIGGTKNIQLDVRIIIASNENLWDAIKRGKFREDLFHRFNEFAIHVPPLRDRKEDIMIFASYFLKKASIELQKKIKGFSPEVEVIFKNYSWPGNLRELKNVVKRAVLLTDGLWIEDRSLPFEITNFDKLQFERDDGPPATTVVSPIEEKARFDGDRKHVENSLRLASIDREYELIMKTIKENNFNKSKAAKALNIDRKTLYNKIALYRELTHGKHDNGE